MGSQGREAGQHLAEFALVIGVVAVAAMSMQFMARRAIQRGLQAASDTVLGPPLVRLGEAGVPTGCVDTDGDGLCNCDDSDRDGACDNVTSDSTLIADEIGLGGGQRQTVLAESVAGQAEGVFVQLRGMGTQGTAIPRPPPGPSGPPDPGDGPEEPFPK